MRIIKFETRFRANKDPEDWVLIAPAGAGYEKTRTWLRIKEITPPEHLRGITTLAEANELPDTHAAMVARWLAIGPAYEAYKRSEEIPLEGTPLAQWPGVTQSQANMLRGMGIRTVEEVTEMNDTALALLKWPNARKLPELAKKYLEGQDASAKDAQIAEMAERMAAMEALLEEKQKRGPGRPKKSEVAA